MPRVTASIHIYIKFFCNKFFQNNLTDFYELLVFVRDRSPLGYVIVVKSYKISYSGLYTHKILKNYCTI